MAERSFATILDKLLYAQRQAVLYCPPLGALLMKLRFRPEPEQKETLRALSNGALLYNPENVDAIGLDQLVSHMTHGVFHTALREGMRNQFYPPEKFRIALESKLHQIIEEAGLPEIFGTDRNTAWDNMAPEDCIEQISDEITVEQAIDMCPLKLPLTIGRDDDDPDDDDSEGGSDTRPPLLTAALGEMAAMAKDIGSDMLGLQLVVGKIYDPQIDWRQKLRFAISQVPGLWGRSYRHPNRRGHGIRAALKRPFILPGPDRGFESVVLVFDLSFSVVGDRGLVEDYLGEMHGILKLCQRPCRVILHEVGVVDDFECKDIRTIIDRLNGGGGTCFRPTYELLSETKEKIPLVVWMTDLYGAHCDSPPPFPMIFVCGENHDTAPWGRIIEIPQQRGDREMYDY